MSINESTQSGRSISIVFKPIESDDKLKIVSFQSSHRMTVDISVTMTVQFNRTPIGIVDADDFNITGLKTATINQVLVDPNDNTIYTLYITRDINDIGILSISLKDR